ncbi:MAG: ribosomal protein S18-alanine N-acetyltransferase [Terricaulis sp.]
MRRRAIVSVGVEAAEALAAIHAEAFTRGWSPAEIRALMRNPGAFALADTAGAGFVLGWAAAGEAEIVTLAVRTIARRKGLGAALVAAAIEVAWGSGAGNLHLEAAEDNMPALALYEKLGFAPVGVRPKYYSDGGANAVVMRRTLPG